MFKGLNAEYGITCILVTHEDRVSRVAHRVIRLEDGRIQGEVINRGIQAETGKKEEDKGKEGNKEGEQDEQEEVDG